jgi:hypothetical protein
MAQSDFLTELLAAVEKAAQPLVDAFGSGDPDAIGAILGEFGWTQDPSSTFAEIQTVLGAVAGAITSLEGGSSGQLVTNIPALINAIQGLKTAATSGTWPAPFNQPNFFLGTATSPGFVDELLGYLLARFLAQEHPAIFGALRAFGIITKRTLPSSTGRGGYTQYLLNPAQLEAFLSDPGGTFKKMYFDASGNLSIGTVFGVLSAVGAAFGWPIFLTNATADMLAAYGSSPPPGATRLPVLTIPVFSVVTSQAAAGSTSSANNPTGTEFLHISLNILPLFPKNVAPGSRAPPSGIAITPLFVGDAVATIPLSPTTQLSFQGDISTAPVVLDIRPAPDGITLGPAPPTAFKGSLRIDGTAPAGSPWTVIGDPTSTCVQVTALHASLTVTVSGSSFNFAVEAAADNAVLSIDLGDDGVDGFIQTLLGSDPIKITLPSGMAWSSQTGFRFNGDAKLATTIPLHVDIAGVVTIDSVYLALQASSGDPGVAIIAAASGGLNIGPLSASVDKIGLQIVATAPAGGKGNLGPLDISFRFKPPDGLGADLDMGPVSGGGYLSFDDSKKEYAGILAVSFGMPGAGIDLVLIGILDTILPGGASGYSFLIIVTVDFPPIQLGLGFTLNGVGGLAGINRTMVLSALQTAVLNGDADYILFPVDPIAHAADLISTVSSIFPAAQGRYTFGPMLELGYGTPQILDFQLGIIIEVPEPIRLAILGIIELGFPSLEVAEPDMLIVDINIDVVGTIDFDQKQLVIEASLYDSRIVEFTLSGDMYMQYDWGSTPQFLLSMGGFNPHFTPPAGIPTLRRLSLGLGSDDITISLTTYLAVTSNTFQCGADLDVKASGGDFSIHGYMAFDALFIFHPFSLKTEMQAGVDVLSGSSVLFQVALDLNLSGPKPWVGQGSASFHIWFVSISVPVNFTIGDAGALDPLSLVSILPLLATALADPVSWSALLSEDLKRSVTLTSSPAGSTQVLVHPMGQLVVSQRVVPLDYAISKFGNDAPADGATFAIESVQLNGAALASGPALSDAAEYFARGQFVNLSDSDKLAAKSFEQFHSGKQVGSAQVLAPSAQSSLTEQFTLYYVDDLQLASTRITPRQYTRPAALSTALMGQSASAGVPVRNKGDSKYVAPGTISPIRVADPQYVVVDATSLVVNGGVSPAGGTTQALACANLQSFQKSNPGAANSLKVISLYEAAA